MFSFELQESAADPCLFYRNSDDDKLIVGVYVDDGLVAAKKKTTIEKFLSRLKAEFRITAEPAGCFLIILINRFDDGTIVISQKKYTENILRRFNMENANSVFTPIERCQLTEEVADAETTDAPYREAVGCLIYLAVATRPDIAFAVGYVSQFLEKPKEQHWTMVKRILKYLKGTITMGIRYKAAGMAGELESYSDADYASDEATRRSVSGMIFKFSGGAIVWASKRQQSVALSTTEAEYVAASEAAKDSVWLSRLFNEISPLKNVPLLVDNASAIKLAKNPTFHKRSKHIDVRAHFVRERVQNGELKIEHIPSKEQVADILTKPIPRVQFQRLREKLGMIEH